ncbi:MAG: hypothetical protein ACREOU_03555 [Candidatus Eiseniibacteriota bacterium]
MSESYASDLPPGAPAAPSDPGAPAIPDAAAEAPVPVVSVRPKRDVWDKVQIILQPVGGLLTALAIALLGVKSSEFLNRRQALETNSRLYSELMSKREESESALRKDMFQTIIASFVSARSQAEDMNSAVLNLELLAYNFHESLNLKPLFLDLKRRIAAKIASAPNATVRAEYTDYMNRLERVAREIARKQVIVLEGVGRKFDRSVDLSGDPEGTSLEGATLTLDSLQATFGLDILSVDRANRELMVGLTVETPDPELGRQTKTANFSVSYFDFPMIDNTRLQGGSRCAVVLNAFSDVSADITIVLFPGAYASLKEKPYYSEVIESVRRENERAGQ